MSIQEFTTSLTVPAPLRLGRTALFLDLDGTLAPLAARPQDVTPDARRTSLLARLSQRLDRRLAVISGRTLTDVDRILESCITPVAAVHGLVRRTSEGQVLETAPHPALAEATASFRDFAKRDSGLLVEEKDGLSVALHYRLAPQQADGAKACARILAEKTGLSLQEGDKVEELRTPGPSKGDSVCAFMSAPPFAGARPVFVGDDATDEDGFAAAQTLGGFGVLIGPPRRTDARYRLDGVEDVLAWLEAAA